MLADTVALLEARGSRREQRRPRHYVIERAFVQK